MMTTLDVSVQIRTEPLKDSIVEIYTSTFNYLSFAAYNLYAIFYSIAFSQPNNFILKHKKCVLLVPFFFRELFGLFRTELNMHLLFFERKYAPPLYS